MKKEVTIYRAQNGSTIMIGLGGQYAPINITKKGKPKAWEKLNTLLREDEAAATKN